MISFPGPPVDVCDSAGPIQVYTNPIVVVVMFKVIVAVPGPQSSINGGGALGLFTMG